MYKWWQTEADRHAYMLTYTHEHKKNTCMHTLWVNSHARDPLDVCVQFLNHFLCLKVVDAHVRFGLKREGG